MNVNLPKDTCVGILGDGQLGRMIITNGIAPLGYRAAVLGPGGRNSPAGQVAWWVEAWGKDGRVSQKLLREFCRLVHVVLIEWENVPCELVDRITKMGVPVMPGSHVLKVAQDRYLEKTTAQKVGIAVPEFRLVDGSAPNKPRPEEFVPYDCILKTRFGGYDGKGQVRLNKGELLYPAWKMLGKVRCILEKKIEFLGEMSSVVARAANHTSTWLTTYGPFENFHNEGILRTTTYPIHSRTFGEYTDSLKFDANHVAVTLADHLNVHGLLAVEFFVSKDGELIFNEMAPRPHNSGHGTMEWYQTDQFEQYVRAALNLPMGECKLHRGGIMHNLLGQNSMSKDNFLRQGSFVGYGKFEVKPDRKMGHQTISKPL